MHNQHDESPALLLSLKNFESVAYNKGTNYRLSRT